MPNNLLDYTNYDFDDIVLQLQTRLKSTDAWKDIYRSSTGSMLIEFLAYVLNLTNYYTERRTEESFINTAQNITSVRNIVSLLNYVPKRKTSAIGNLQFTIPLALSKIVFIPKYIECQSVDGLKYVTNESAAIQKGQTSITVIGIQGELVQKEITSDGAVSQEYLVDDDSVENSASVANPTFRVIVDGTEWTLVSSFLNSVNTSEHYRIINENEGTVSVLFGDNINGLAPTSGSTILINYIKSDGSSGNVTFNDKITTINDTIYDEDTSVISDITVTNTSAFLGGDVEEDIEEIRYEAPRVFKTGGRGVNTKDFIAILENFPGVANVNVWGENEEALAAGVGAVQSMLNKVKIVIVLQEWELPDATFQAVLAAYIYNLSMLTVKYEFVEPVILYVIPKMTVKVATGESLSQAQANIEEVMAAQFLLGDTTKLGFIIKYSRILSAVHALSDVSYANMTLEIRKVLTTTYNSNFDWGELLEAIPIQPETINLYIDDVLVTADVDGGAGTGTFSDAGGYTISGSVDYTTGIMNVDISDSPASVYVRYQQAEEGNIVPTFRQISKLQEVDITSITMES
jgi:hypothetical protein